MKTLELRLRDVVVIDLREELNMPQVKYIRATVSFGDCCCWETPLTLQPTATAHTSTQPAADIKKVNSTRHQKWR